MLAFARRDAEGLLHQAVGFVAIPIAITIHLCIFVRRSPTIRCFPTQSPWRRYKIPSSPLALHFAVCQEASRDSTSTPALPIRPSSHASFPFIPDKHASGCYALPFLLRQAPLDSRQQSSAAGFEKFNRVSRVADMSSVGLHL